MQVADRVERSDVGGVRPERLIDRRPSGRVPSRAPVHLRQHQIDVAARRIERRGPPQLRLVVAGVSFVVAIGLVVALNQRAVRSPATSTTVGFHFEDIAARAGITFLHHGPNVDAKLDNIAPLMAALGASVSVSDVDNDGWPDLYFTNSRFGYPNALYLNRGDGTFVDVP